MSAETIYPYDLELYDRRFLNCGQRHAMVFLEKMGVPVNLLFYSALPSSDQVLQQMVVEKKPKFAFACRFYAPEDLAAIGVHEHVLEQDRFAELQSVIEQRLSTEGFVLLSGDVFYFPHCPEYRNAHLPHIVVLRGRNPDGSWEVVDDNAASVLCEYTYPHAMVRDFCENNSERKLRYYDVERTVSFTTASQTIQPRFAQFIAQYQDSYWFYDQIETLLDNPLDAPPLKLKALHDAFTLLSGSRRCFAKYLEESGAPALALDKAHTFAEAAFVLKSIMVKAQLTGKLNAAGVIERCAGLKQLELDLLSALRQGAHHGH